MSTELAGQFDQGLLRALIRMLCVPAGDQPPVVEH